MDKNIGPLTDINTVNCAGYFIEILGTEISGLGGRVFEHSQATGNGSNGRKVGQRSEGQPRSGEYKQCSLNKIKLPSNIKEHFLYALCPGLKCVSVNT